MIEWASQPLKTSINQCNVFFFGCLIIDVWRRDVWEYFHGSCWRSILLWCNPSHKQIRIIIPDFQDIYMLSIRDCMIEYISSSSNLHNPFGSCMSLFLWKSWFIPLSFHKMAVVENFLWTSPVRRWRWFKLFSETSQDPTRAWRWSWFKLSLNFTQDPTSRWFLNLPFLDHIDLDCHHEDDGSIT
jgi:hypothetical protein